MNETNSSKTELLNEIQRLRAELLSVHRNTETRIAQIYNSEERFALAMRGANDGLWDWNLLTDDVYYSPCWKSMLGYDDNELENTLATWSSLVHSKEKDPVLKSVQEYLAGETESFEVEMRMLHKNGSYVFVRSRAFKVSRESNGEPVGLIGTHVDITSQKKADKFDKRHAKIIEMIAKGNPVSDVYVEIALLYEDRHPGLRCSMLELQGNTLLHGGAPSLPQGYADAVNGLLNGPDVGSCGASTFTGKRVLVESIETDPKWADLKAMALPYGMRCCWSEPIISSSGKVLGAFGMYYDHPALPNEEESNDLLSASRLASIVMEREQNQKQIRDLAYTDELTGLSSRTHFYLNIEELIKVSLRNNHQFGLLYIDLDNFKNVNDTLGHDVGDLLLKEVALRLKSTCREIDYIARLSGDEFCIVVNDVKDDYGTAHVAQRCLDLVSTAVDFFGRTFIPACSIGIAHYPENGSNLQALLKAADTALYSAKDFGRNRYAFYKDELTLKAEYRFKVEQYLKEAIEKQQLSLVYQPKIDINTGLIESVEALSRWYHPQLGHISPKEFIKLAEQIDMIKPLTEWVLKTACNQAELWKKAGFQAIRMAVNISSCHFLDSSFVSLIEKIIDETGIQPGELELEVTEGVVQTNTENMDVFDRLKELGTLLTIDDFGIGYSSIASLKHLNVDFLKIDKCFVDEILTDSKTRVLIQSMIEMGHSLGYKITAEGIEKENQFNELKKLGCDSAQGHLFSKPVSPNEISKLLAKNKSI
jgi:diguanylate cyclase (GGDEF)-like protein/PAS domain S-box-containing protein